MIPPRFTCIMYHNIEGDSVNPYSIGPRAFKEQIRHFIDLGYVIEGFSGLSERLISGRWPGKYLMISFDDGHRSFLDAAEILNSFGIRGSFYLTRRLCLEMEDHLDPSEIRQLATIADLGTHGLTHQPLTRLTPEAALNELVESKEWLEQCISRPVHSMTAPGGFWNARLQKMSEAAGYILVGTSKEWWNTPTSAASSHSIARVAIRQMYTDLQVDDIVTLRRIFYLKRLIREKLIYLPKAILTRMPSQP